MLNQISSFVRRYLRMLVLIVAALPAVDWLIDERVAIAKLQATYDVVAPRWGKLNIRDPDRYHVLYVPSEEKGFHTWRIYVPRLKNLTLFVGEPGRSMSSNHTISDKQPFEFVFQVKLGPEVNGRLYSTTCGRAMSANLHGTSSSLPAGAKMEISGVGEVLRVGQDETVTLALFRQTVGDQPEREATETVLADLPRIAIGTKEAFAAEAEVRAKKKKR